MKRFQSIGIWAAILLSAICLIGCRMERATAPGREHSSAAQSATSEPGEETASDKDTVPSETEEAAPSSAASDAESPSSSQPPASSVAPPSSQPPVTSVAPPSSQPPVNSVAPPNSQPPVSSVAPPSSKPPVTSVAPPSSQPPVTSAPPSENDALQLARQVIAIVNSERAAQGLPALRENAQLMGAALVRSQEIFTKFAHERPNGEQGYELAFDAGFRTVGENIAYGYPSAEGVMKAWMNSPGHRANILQSAFTEIGVGCYQGADGALYWTQLFGG